MISRSRWLSVGVMDGIVLCLAICSMARVEGVVQYEILFVCELSEFC